MARTVLINIRNFLSAMIPLASDCVPERRTTSQRPFWPRTRARRRNQSAAARCYPHRARSRRPRHSRPFDPMPKTTTTTTMMSPMMSPMKMKTDKRRMVCPPWRTATARRPHIASHQTRDPHCRRAPTHQWSPRNPTTRSSTRTRSRRAFRPHAYFRCRSLRPRRMQHPSTRKMSHGCWKGRRPPQIFAA